jgi:hypothetical protein
VKPVKSVAKFFRVFRALVVKKSVLIRVNPWFSFFPLWPKFLRP